MKHETGNRAADFLLKQTRMLRLGNTPEAKQEADRWEQIIRDHANVRMSEDVSDVQPEPSKSEAFK
jgi:hypothetical protein